MRGTPFGRYELLRKIAAGGMAEIFLARQWGEDGFFRDVVIKRLFRHMAEHERALEMFQYEARLLAELSHPNIPQVYDLGFEDGTWFLTMEYVEGHNVADVFVHGARAGQVMPMQVAAAILVQACEALHHAHERRDRAGRPLRIVHRDVTPQNIMITGEGVVKLMDFGVAQTAARKNTEAGAIKGTFSYMAPEQVRARPLDKRADVFALGVVLYELTTGTRLYRGSDVQVMTAIVEHDAPPPSTRVPDYPPDLEDIVMAALSRDRSRRLPSAAHMALALEDFALRHGIHVGPRTVAKYMSTVFPYEREKQPDVALVAPSLEVVPDADVSGDWDVVTDSDDVRPAGNGVWDPSLDDDLSFLEPELEEESTIDEALPRPLDLPGQARQALPPDEVESLLDEPAEGTIQPPALAGFDEDRGDRPVVLLGDRKADRKGERRKRSERDYMAELERRLKEED